MRKEYDLSQLKGRRNPYSKKLKGELISVLAFKALKKAVRGVIADRKMRGEPLIIWKNGKVLKVPANQLNRF